MNVLLPTDSPQLTEEQLSFARGVIRRCLDLAFSDVADPAEFGGWFEVNRFPQLQGIVDGDAEAINRLRLACAHFSGCSIGQMILSGNEVPSAAQATENLQRLAATPDAYVRRHLTLAQFPDAVRFYHEPPRVLGECGWLADGALVGHDTYILLERLYCLTVCGVMDGLGRTALEDRRERPPVVVEIGAGHGALAYQIIKSVPDCCYVIVDLPQSIIFSAIYLAVATGKTPKIITEAAELRYAPGEIFIIPADRSFDVLAGQSADLAINTLSMSEMTQEWVERYCRLLRGLLGRNGVFFEQNMDNSFLFLPDGSNLTNAERVIEPHFSASFLIDAKVINELLDGCTVGRPNLHLGATLAEIDADPQPTGPAPHLRRDFLQPLIKSVRPDELRRRIAPADIRVSSCYQERFGAAALAFNSPEVWHARRPSRLPEWVELTFAEPISPRTLYLQCQPTRPARAGKDIRLTAQGEDGGEELLLQTAVAFDLQEDWSLRLPLSPTRPAKRFRLEILSAAGETFVSMKRVWLSD